ncbi:MAG: hypothetical protein IJY89_01620, partial [Clostridia bacterium]|nr:hypothetical protein [Clostridia bacterium]
YAELASTVSGDGRHIFTVPAGIGAVLLTVKGDTNGDGNISIADVAQLLDVLAGTGTIDPLLLGDLNDDENISIADVARILDVLSGKDAF